MNAGSAGPPDAAERIALIAAALPLLIVGSGGDYEHPDPVHFAVLIAGIAGIAGVLARKRWAGTLVLLSVLTLGAYMRAVVGESRASDVMAATNEALTTLAGGNNPYSHFYTMTNPPGGLFGYPPGEFAFYGLVHLFGISVFRVDAVAGILGLGLIASLAPLIGDGLAALAIGTMGPAVDVIFHSSDGSNDTAASFLALLGLVALRWSFAVQGRRAQALWWTSAVAFGWVIAFKEYALPIALFVALFLWRADRRRARGWIVAACAAAAAFVLPFLAWNPVAFVQNVGGALIVHQDVWGRNVWHDVLTLQPGEIAIAPLIPLVTLLAFAFAAVAFWRRPAPTLGAAFLQGCALVGLIFVLARWTSSVYYIFLTPLVLAGIALTLGSDNERPGASQGASET